VVERPSSKKSDIMLVESGDNMEPLFVE